jgi:hypothetical protein
MNIYSKLIPNVFVAKCSEKHEKGDVIPVTTKHGKENDCIVFNLIYQKEGFYFYSIVRADGFNVQEWAKKKAEKLEIAANNADKKSTEFYKKSNDAVAGIVLGQPILIGHHSEKRHRADLEKSWSAMGKSIEMDKKAEDYESRAEYWKQKANIINLSMPESLEFYEFQLEKAKAKHEFYKNNPDKREHSFSLTYAKKEVNEIEKKIEWAKKLWE